MRRAAITMTLDPDGAMHDWIDPPPGWELLRLPSQEALHAIGVAEWQALLVELCERARPDVLVTHPPYDWITTDGARAIRATGTRLVGYAFDDAIFDPQRALHERAALRAIYDRYATTSEVPWATAPREALDERPATVDVALVGRAYARRAALVSSLRAAGITVATRGAGWPEGWASRREMEGLFARARVVLTTADWEEHDVPMVKHRLLDAAMMGVFQIAQQAPDLRAYFTDEEVPSFQTADELVERVRALLPDEERRRNSARAARERCLREHTWSVRWRALLDGVALGEPRLPVGEPGRYLQLLMALGTRAESMGRAAAAAALYEERLRAGASDGASAGAGRCLRDLGRPAEAVLHLESALAAPVPLGAAAIEAQIAPAGVGSGVGRLGLLPPQTETLVHLIAALLECGRDGEAASRLDRTADRRLARAAARAITLDDALAAPSLRAAIARALA